MTEALYDRQCPSCGLEMLHTLYGWHCPDDDCGGYEASYELSRWGWRQMEHPHGHDEGE